MAANGTMMRGLLTGLLCLVATGTLASPVGDWVVADRSARVKITTCGANLCGRISWTADGKDLGQPVLLDMKSDGPKWTGTVVDVRDGSKYLAHLTLQSERELKLDGCALGGLVCKGEVWTRYR